jgi:hypothetical protein
VTNSIDKEHLSENSPVRIRAGRICDVPNFTRTELGSARNLVRLDRLEVGERPEKHLVSTEGERCVVSNLITFQEVTLGPL